MCKEGIVPTRVKFFAQALEIRSPPIDVIDRPSSEEEWNGEAYDILFSAVVNDLHRSETSRLTQRDIRDLKEFDMLPAAFLGDDYQQRQIEKQVADFFNGKPREEHSYQNQENQERANTSPRDTHTERHTSSASLTEADLGHGQTRGTQ